MTIPEKNVELTDSQMDRKTDRKTERQTDRQTDRQIGRQRWFVRQSWKRLLLQNSKKLRKKTGFVIFVI